MPGKLKVMTTLRPSQISTPRTSPPTLTAITSSPPIRPKIAPEAPRVPAAGSENQYTSAEAVRADPK